jgi:hypothetical protein
VNGAIAMMTKYLTVASLLTAIMFLSLFVFADDDHRWGFRGPDVEPVNDADYASECGACHFAYQPGLLPARSWKELMKSLDNHFGENAELDAAANDRITGYLTENAADNAKTWLSKRIIKSIRRAENPLRIIDLPIISHEHDEIPARLYRDNPEVGSLSNCAACHQRADAGLYDEHTVVIPGFGNWDD